MDLAGDFYPTPIPREGRYLHNPRLAVDSPVKSAPKPAEMKDLVKVTTNALHHRGIRMPWVDIDAQIEQVTAGVWCGHLAFITPAYGAETPTPPEFRPRQ
jgi:hypothetical protein